MAKRYLHFEYRIYPTKAQDERLRRWEHASRALWNIAHEQRLIGLKKPSGYQQFYSSYDQMNELPALCREYDFIDDMPRNAAQNVMTRLDRAWSGWLYKKTYGMPKFKRKQDRRPVAICQPSPRCFRMLSDKAISFAKVGKIRAVIHRPIVGTAKECDLFRQGEQWFAVFTCQQSDEQAPPVPRATPVVALDRGITYTVADSDGNLVENPHHRRKTQRRLAHAQRVAARRVSLSANKGKAHLRIGVLARKVKRQRRDFLHKLAHRYANSHGTVIIENLPVAAMKATGNLSNHIDGAGWATLANYLEQKLRERGGRLLRVAPHYSSVTCAKCGARGVRKAQRFFCPSCGNGDHADLNAAKVLLIRGGRGEAVCGGSAEVRRPLKQKAGRKCVAQPTAGH